MASSPHLLCIDLFVEAQANHRLLLLFEASSPAITVVAHIVAHITYITQRHQIHFIGWAHKRGANDFWLMDGHSGMGQFVVNPLDEVVGQASRSFLIAVFLSNDSFLYELLQFVPSAMMNPAKAKR